MKVRKEPHIKRMEEFDSSKMLGAGFATIAAAAWEHLMYLQRFKGFSLSKGDSMRFKFNDAWVTISRREVQLVSAKAIARKRIGGRAASNKQHQEGRSLY